MKNNDMLLKIINILIIGLLVVITLCGILSFNRNNAYDIVNQYGDTIKMYGSGIYRHDSYFKAPIFIGSDFTILLVVVPLLVLSWCRKGLETVEGQIRNLALLGVVLYYCASIALGVTYNELHLVYNAAFGISFYGVAYQLFRLFSMDVRKKIVCEYSVSKGMIVFLCMTGVALFAAWLPDVIWSLVQGTTLGLIEVYTTDITYVLDMALVSPMMFIILILVLRKSFMGYVLFRMALTLCTLIAVMVPAQSLVQWMCNIELPLPALLTKVFSFMVLGVFAWNFERKLRGKSMVVREKA